MSVFSRGLRLHDRFTLVERIGAGGMSEVWRASDDLLGREVAVKALITPLATEPGLREATWREARAAARITHPNVTQVHDYGEIPLPGGGGVAGYLVMELVEGQTLAQRLAGGPLPWPDAVRVGAQVAAALAAAHRLGVVHRDIKPGNVMLTETGVKVLDLGIASVAGSTDTDPGRLLGTPRYAAPERFDADAPTVPANDVYSLGVLLYEALVGRPLTRSQTWREAAAAHRSGAAAAVGLPVAGLPELVARLCRACLSPDPAARPTAAEVASGLSAAAGEATAPPAMAPRAAVPPATSLPPTAVSATRPEAHVRRGRGLLLVGAVAAVVIGLGAALLLAALRSGDGGPEQPGGGTLADTATEAPAEDRTGSAPAPATPQDLVNELDQEVRAAFNQGAITRDAYDELRDEVAELREALAEDDPAKRDEELRKAAEEMRQEVEDQLADGEVDGPRADTLIALLDQLIEA